MSDVALVPSPFEQWGSGEGYDISPALSPCPARIYADRQTQAAYEAWLAGAAYIVRMLTESTIETDALREKIRELASNSDRIP